MNRFYMLNVPIDNCGMAEAVRTVANLAAGKAHSTIADRSCARVYFLNAHCGNVASKVPEYKAAMRRADYVFADGSGVKLAGRIQGTPVDENVNGTDMFPLLMQAFSTIGARVFFIGAKRRVIARLVTSAAERWPGVRITGWTLGYFHEDQEVLDAVRLFGADAIFVAMGVPRQELWIDRWADQSGARVALAVGGLFDFYSGIMPRAPLWMRRLGVEWLYRLYREPGRMWRRYLLGNVAFLARILAHKRKGARK
jgi:N-acetylglucosaminyldiphosphoundecaprenol N-acetyl-beta-D-mannosaminyltransferase